MHRHRVLQARDRRDQGHRGDRRARARRALAGLDLPHPISACTSTAARTRARASRPPTSASRASCCRRSTASRCPATRCTSAAGSHRRPRRGRPRPHRPRPQGHRRRHRRLRRARRPAVPRRPRRRSRRDLRPVGAPRRRGGTRSDRHRSHPRVADAVRTPRRAARPRRGRRRRARQPDRPRGIPAEVVAWVARNFGADAAAVACSMADAALPHLVAEQLPGVDVLFLDTGYHFAETTRTRDEVGRALDVRRRRRAARADRRRAGRRVRRKDSTPATPRLCCARRKVAPLQDALGGYEVWFTGVRREEAPTRANTPLVTWDERNGLVKVNPVAAWTFDDLLDYAGAHQVPVNLLLSQRLPLDRLRAVHQAGRAGRGPPVRPLGRASPRPNAGCTYEHCHRRLERARAGRPTLASPTRLASLDVLEAEAIHIIREVVAEFERPVLLFSGGKDSVVVLHLAAKAFSPGRVPFPVLHVDTGHNFPEVLAFRDETVERLGVRLEVGPRAGLHRRRPPAGARRRHPQPAADAAAARRDRAPAGTTPSSAAPAATRTRPAPRSGSSRCATSSASGTRATSAPSCGACTTAGTPPASTCAPSRSRTGPSSTSGATSSARASRCRRCTSRTSARCMPATACGARSASSRRRAPTRPSSAGPSATARSAT